MVNIGKTYLHIKLYNNMNRPVAVKCYRLICCIKPGIKNGGYE
jgi:hypothetical protein